MRHDVLTFVDIDFRFNTMTLAEENDCKLGKKEFDSEYELIDNYVAFKAMSLPP